MKTIAALSVLLMVFWFPFTLKLRAADPALGLWKLNVTKSVFDPGPVPKSGSIHYEISDSRYKVTVETIEADGTTTRFEYVAECDGRDYPVIGSKAFDTIAGKCISEYTCEFALKKGNRVVRSMKRSVTQDGKVLTFTLTGLNDKGEKIHYITVYEKQ